MNTYAIEKMEHARRLLLADYSEHICGIFAMGSINQEATLTSDLDVVVVFDDQFFSECIEELRSLLKEIAAYVNSEMRKHPLVLWASKVDHYCTNLQDVSYVRASLPYAEDRLDAWCGLAKHTLIKYELSTCFPVYGELTKIASLSISTPIPRYEALELFLIATRTFAKGLVELRSPHPDARRCGQNHVAKAGLRACYAVLIGDKCEPTSSYAEIRDAAFAKFPGNFRDIIEQLYRAKTADETVELRLDDVLSLFRFCESQIAMVPRLTIGGATSGLLGESFAFGWNQGAFSESKISPEEYSRYVGPDTNYVHMLYFIITACEILRQFGDTDFDDGSFLDFFFDEIVLVYSLVLGSSGHLRIVLGHAEREVMDLYFQYNDVKQMVRLFEHLAQSYVMNPTPGSLWLPSARKRAVVALLLELTRTANPSEKGISEWGINELKKNISEQDYVDALVWQCSLLEGIFHPRSIRLMSQTGLSLYKAGFTEDALKIMDRVLRFEELKQNASTESGDQAAQVIRNFDLELSKAYQYHGVILYKLGRIQEAKKSYLMALDLDCDNYSAIDDLNSLLIEHEKSEDAFTLMRQCLDRCAHKTAEARRQVSSRYMAHAIELKRAGRLLDAKTWCDRALVIEPDYEVIHYNFAILRQDMGDPECAKNLLFHAIDLNPDYLNPYVRLALLLEQSDLRGAMDLLHTAHERGLGNEHSYTNLGNCYFRIGEIDAAEVYYSKALELKDDYANALYGMRIVHLQRYDI